jgi:predicted nucleotidyltransferase
MGSGIPGPTLRFDPMVDVPESLTLDERRVIDRWIEVLREEIDREPVWLFGSVARGERREGSDVDLLVITRGDAERDRQRVWRTVDEVAREMGLNPAPFVPHTWDRAWLEGRAARAALSERDRNANTHRGVWAAFGG